MSGDGVQRAHDPAGLARLYQRLRRPPTAHTVAGALPVLFFGDLFTAEIATVGLNPSDHEYVDQRGIELTGGQRRFETLTSLGAASRMTLTDDQCARAIETMRSYYQREERVYSWFRGLFRVIEAMGYTYRAGQVAHLEVVQEATRPAWAELERMAPLETKTLFAADREFLRWQLRNFAPRAVVCNGRTVFDEVRGIVERGRIVNSGELARLTWYVGLGHVDGQPIGLAGWNLPLARATGLGAEGERDLGRLLASELRRIGGL
ncbi:MAG TPA: hypothetical protein VIC85_09860 [Ktedonobacterales bacterium]|jgi:hypothetical protein